MNGKGKNSINNDVFFYFYGYHVLGDTKYIINTPFS